MPDNFLWKLHPKGASFLGEIVERFHDGSEYLQELRKNLHVQTSTRLMDWIDHMLVPRSWINEELIEEAGFTKENVKVGDLDLIRLRNENSTLFPLFITDKEIGRLYLKVEDIEAIATIHDLTDKIEGKKWAPRRKLILATSGILSVGAIERRGYDGYEIPEWGDEENYAQVLDRFMNRNRNSDTETAFNELERMIEDGVKVIGTDRTADAFFFSERRYWESRNSTGRIQLQRQNLLGLGWGNHDHHTFRCSREYFCRTISILEKIGMKPRERFYAGEQAGWGAQVMEHEVCSIAVFADVDLTPEEKDGDFAHQGLTQLDSLGTVGLWAGLHGESILSAGLHHIAAKVEFSRMMKDSLDASIVNMGPFSSFPYLKQCFTEGERWKIENDDPKKLFEKGMITKEQMDRFSTTGALGSHLEFIERNEGFKGFNQEAVSDIIDRTDPRK